MSRDPDWDKGVPLHSDECGRYDGKRCRDMGFQPQNLCEPEVRDMARSMAIARDSGVFDEEPLTSDQKDRLGRAKQWATGEWIRVREDRAPLRYGRYELMSDRRFIVDFFRPTTGGYVVMSDIAGSHTSWESFCRTANENGLHYIWSEPILFVFDGVDKDKKFNVRLPDGTPRVRDVDNPCHKFEPGKPEGDCDTDGHYLCAECTEKKVF